LKRFSIFLIISIGFRQAYKGSPVYIDHNKDQDPITST